MNKNTEGVSPQILNTFNNRLMKRFFIFAYTFLLCYVAEAQLVVYSNLNLQGTSGSCVVRTIYKDATIPNGLNNAIKSIALSKGYMATVAENADGSGERFSYMANVSDLKVNLATQLQNNVSFIRVLPLPSTPVKKKGACATNNTQRDALNGSWFYDWGINDVSTTSYDYTPMIWGAYSSIETSITNVVDNTNLTNFLAFNEPDSRGQSGGSGGGMADDATLAVPFYKKMLRAGMRMGSPATTENEYRFWLQDFVTSANTEKLRIDFIAVHWYDWGNWTSSSRDNNVNAVGIFNRFKSYIDAVYTRYGKPIWITEFNANPNRTSAVQEAFMRLALPWLDANNKVERYAFFFEQSFLPTSGGLMTPVGLIYSSHSSTSAYLGNITDPRGSTVVPVELVDFKGQYISSSGGQGAGNLLTWRTASENKNSHFDMECSNNGSDFEKIGTVKGNGTTQQMQDYEFLDTRPEGLHYYRLRQVDFDGKYEFSPVISLNPKGKSIKITPSVSNQFLTVEMPFDQATMVVSDMLGRITLSQTLNNGQNIDISQLPTGHYVVSVLAKGDKMTARFFKN